MTTGETFAGQRLSAYTAAKKHPSDGRVARSSRCRSLDPLPAAKALAEAHAPGPTPPDVSWCNAIGIVDTVLTEPGEIALSWGCS